MGRPLAAEVECSGGDAEEECADPGSDELAEPLPAAAARNEPRNDKGERSTGKPEGETHGGIINAWLSSAHGFCEWRTEETRTMLSQEHDTSHQKILAIEDDPEVL